MKRAPAVRYIVDERGVKTAVILPLRAYECLLEDLHDLAVVAERKEVHSVSLEEVLYRLKRDGLLPDVL